LYLLTTVNARTHLPSIAVLGLLTSASACRSDLDEVDSMFYAGGHRPVHCGIDIDSRARLSLADIDRALDRARDREETVELYAHRPGVTVEIDVLEHVFAGARDRGLRFVTYRDMTTEEPPGAGLAFAFDDASVKLWWEIRDLLLKYDARITFFLSRYATLYEDEREMMRVFAADGHDLEAHSVNHLSAPEYVETNGVTTYMREEVKPSLDVLHADGYDPVAYAYPFGRRTRELDEAILGSVAIVRSIVYAWSGVNSPCPE